MEPYWILLCSYMTVSPSPPQEKQVFDKDKGDLQLVQVQRELKCGVSSPKGVSVSHPLLSSDQIIKKSLMGEREKNARVKGKDDVQRNRVFQTQQGSSIYEWL